MFLYTYFVGKALVVLGLASAAIVSTKGWGALLFSDDTAPTLTGILMACVAFGALLMGISFILARPYVVAADAAAEKRKLENSVPDRS